MPDIVTHHTVYKWHPLRTRSNPQEKIFREGNNKLHPFITDTTLLLNYVSYLLLVLTLYIDMYIVNPETEISM
jgi:uncharacterized metal-binding protein